MKKFPFFFLAGIILLVFAGGAAYLFLNNAPKGEPFDPERAYQDVEYQVSLGPRTPGSEAHAAVIDWIFRELDEAGWNVSIQESEEMGHPIRNVVASRGTGQPLVVLGAHYDSRFFADNDPDPANHSEPVLGANDGASGVAVLLELARTLPQNSVGEIRLVFFDAEDQGRIEGWDWILGSRAYVKNLDRQPDYAVIIDMIGDQDLNIHYEKNSDPELSAQIWNIAAELGFGGQFIPEEKYTILDDHIPFLEAGIRSVDLIDFDYPYWHTTEDTADKVSSESLGAVGHTLTEWLKRILPEKPQNRLFYFENWQN